MWGALGSSFSALLAFCLSIHAQTLSPSQALASIGRTPILSKGESTLLTKSESLSVRVKISTHEVDNGTPGSPKKPKGVFCTGSRYPCSVVDSMQISVNGHPLGIGSSVYSDLADLNSGGLKIDKNIAVLTLYGGDAALSYILKIQMSPTRLQKWTLSSALAPGKPLEERIYHDISIGP
jgi:hypothetical protein